MADQTIDVEELRGILDGDGSAADKIDVLYELLPPPPPPTLADLDVEERGQHIGGQSDVSAEAFGGRAILVGFETATFMGMEFPRARVLTRDCRIFSVPVDEVTPRPDLPRLTWPGAAPTDEVVTDEVVTEEFGIEYETPQIHRGVWDGWFFTEQEARRALQEYPPEWSPRLVRRRVSAPEAVK